MNNGDKPAFPAKIHESERLNEYKLLGLTKREYFAAMAMQTYMQNHGIRRQNIFQRVWLFLSGEGRVIISHGEYNMIASNSIKMADELLKQLNTPD